MPVIEDREYQTLPCIEEDALADNLKLEECSESDNVAIRASFENCVIHITTSKRLRKKIYR